DAIEHRNANVTNVASSLDIRVAGGDGVTTDEIIGIYETFCTAELDNDLAARRDLHGNDAHNHDLARTAAQRSYDAIIAIFRAAASTAKAGVDGTAAATVVNIVTDSTTFARIMAAAGLAPTSINGLPVDPFTGLPAANTLLEDLMADPAGLGSIRCETDRGIPVHPHDVLRAVLAGHIRRVVLDSDGHVIDYGRKKRLFRGPARDAAKLLIRCCQHPGCDLPTGWSDVDHNTEWNEHGRTDQNNAGILCAKHNNAKHHLKLRRQRATNGIDYTILPDGTIILPVGARTPQFHAEDDPDDRPDTPDEIKEMTNIARARLRAACEADAA
ncbi:MAG: HNH endonuclease signature motif containing protein, partial [Ilumatobacter sp.]|uniref:HNH endonuclease signature motif containing protein n=1 Tax=Ilumatobacter sp. TaxID=1967498 RepID=UPI003C721307